MGRKFDFIEDSYPYIKNIDYIIMNPPFGLIEPFTMKSLEIAKKGVLMFGRLQFLEGEKRYINILKDNPPTIFYTYVDRIACFKNGNTLISLILFRHTRGSTGINKKITKLLLRLGLEELENNN